MSSKTTPLPNPLTLKYIHCVNARVYIRSMARGDAPMIRQQIKCYIFLSHPNKKIYLKLKKDQKMKDDKNPWGYLNFFPWLMYPTPFSSSRLFH